MDNAPSFFNSAAELKHRTGLTAGNQPTPELMKVIEEHVRARAQAAYDFIRIDEAWGGAAAGGRQRELDRLLCELIESHTRLVAIRTAAICEREDPGCACIGDAVRALLDRGGIPCWGHAHAHLRTGAAYHTLACAFGVHRRGRPGLAIMGESAPWLAEARLGLRGWTPLRRAWIGAVVRAHF